MTHFLPMTAQRSNPKEAEGIIRENRIDMVLTDIVMPEMSGIELFDRIRSMGADIPVILMTGYADMEKALEAIKRGAFDFIPKPYQPDYLIHAIEKAINYHRLVNMERDYRGILEELNLEIEGLVAERTMSLIALTLADRIRNPSTAIGLTCRRLMENKDLPDKVKDGLNVIAEESAKLENIVSEFQGVVKSRKSMFTYEDINSVLDSIRQLMEREVSYKNIRLTIMLSPEPLRINMERNLFKTAVLHLIRNAAEATKEGESVKLSVFKEDEHAVVEVADMGKGIANEDVERIFSPFFSSKSKSFGMGLPMVKQVVSEHMGNISVKPAEGGGTVFKMEFPLRWAEKH
ncbi:hypothetical protein JZK55_03310 [Dissulfurispira thermophila]|uniref:histidine kinase n=1 Tax=Dissulfurispira thermophila TaxID=2715679 RepID=A0A7G1GZH2_9BACT|nr:hybrid sensor histidine kinase/response regulator [Dissulfurispira thermophila]BCB95409.1 hypothetical protein JZK55_03310 [Dissulfurispira thermophila]